MIQSRMEAEAGEPPFGIGLGGDVPVNARNRQLRQRIYGGTVKRGISASRPDLNEQYKAQQQPAINFDDIQRMASTLPAGAEIKVVIGGVEHVLNNV